MFLKCHVRRKDGKEHRYWSIVEKQRCTGGRTVDRHVLYLGEINDSQREAWLRCIEVFDEDGGGGQQLALFPADREVPSHAAGYAVQVRLREFRLHRPRQWGGCFAFLQLWHELRLDEFWQPRLPASREGTSWYHVLMVLAAYRLLDPGSEWRCHRQWFGRSAMADLLGADAVIAAKDTLYRGHDRLLAHKDALFGHLTQRWQDLFGVTYDVLLYDLTSTYFESDPPFPDGDKRRYGYSRDHRPDCVQVVIALVVTPEGFPLAYEVMPGNTADNTTLPGFVATIESRYGKARRVWLMDRGIPTEAHLDELRRRGAGYLVGTPKGRLGQLEQALLERPWQQVRLDVQVKLLPQEEELYVWVESRARVGKERSMRRRKLKRFWARLRELQRQRPAYETLLLKLGAARQQAGRTASLVEIVLPEPPHRGQRLRRVDFTFSLDRQALRRARRREGRYLLRSNLSASDPALLWEYYLRLVEIEAAFKTLKDDLALRPIFHREEHRIEAHIFIAFLAYCLQVTLRHKLRRHAPGLTPRQALDKLGDIQMLDVVFPTTDGRELVFSRYTQPEKEHKMLLHKLGWRLPAQPPPRISAKRHLAM